MYRHWHTHVRGVVSDVESEKEIRGIEGVRGIEEIFSDPELFDELSQFIHERINIWKKKNEGREGSREPYTTDPILSTYRFCNIFREFDRQTIEFHTLLNPLRDNFPLWLLNMFYCRMVARTETIKEVGLLSLEGSGLGRTDFGESGLNQNEVAYKKLMSLPRPRYGTPYVFPVSVILKSSTPTRELFITKYLPSVMRDVAGEISKWHKQNVYEGVEKVLNIFGYNLHFLWTEVLIDVAYQFPEYIDLFAKFPIGPGSAPTMRRINTTENPSDLVAQLARLAFDTGIEIDGRKLRLSAENWEGIGCEFRKYTNLRAGKGRKRLFRKVN